MEYIMIVLIIIVFILITYIFFQNLELKRLRREIVNIKNNDTNLLLHTGINHKNITAIIDEINNMLTEMKTKEITIDRKQNIIRRMMTNISHDLRTPLTSALGYINIILSSNLTKEEQLKELVIVEERLKRLKELIDSFFEFSKIISSDEEPVLEKVNLVSIIEECIAHYYEDYILDKRQIMFNNNIKQVFILADKVLLMRIFDNLINNALKHSLSNLEIKLNYDKNITIEFINELLVSELDIDKIFDEFYTVDISRTKNNNGLGLAIAKEFTERMNGKIYASKKANQLNITIEFNTNNNKNESFK